MAGRIPDSFLDELVARSDIVEIIGARVQLKKGGREYKACCPFHNEKSPSFWVSPDKQFYHCFGCGAHGTVIGFLMQYEKMDFLDAVAELAQRAGLELPREAQTTRDPGSADLHELMGKAARFFQQNLADNARAAKYAVARGIDAQTLTDFALGYAPDAWDALLKRLGAGEEERKRLYEVGLIIERAPGNERGAGYYDRFRDRLMFPIRDSRGRVIGFGGRVIDQGEPKYLNSPETPLFHKGRELYGLYEARQARTDFKRLLIVEGYMDVVRLHQAGIRYAVATLGTATTQEHLNKIFKMTSEVVFCFDGDRAGRQAARRAMENSLELAQDGREFKFMFLPEGHDPDTLVAEEGPQGIERRLQAAMPLSDYLVQQLSSEVDLTHEEGRARLKALATPLFARMPEGIYRELLAERLAARVSMPAAALKSSFAAAQAARGARSNPRGPEPRPTQRGPLSGQGSTRVTASGALGTGRSPDNRSAAGHGWAGSAATSPASSGRASTGRASAGRASTGRASAGRGNLLTQAITLLMHHPAAARGIATAGLDQLDRPGVPVLRELLDMAAGMETPNTAMLLERWRDRAEYARLSELAISAPLVSDAAGAAKELRMAVEKLVEEYGPGRRMDELLRKAENLGLNSDEKTELSSLLHARGRPRAPQ